MESTDKAVTLMQDMTYAMSQQSQKPVQVSVEAQPVTISLQMEQEKKPANRTVKIIRDEDGKVSSMEVVE